MIPHYDDDAVTLYHGDCLDVLRALPDASVASVVTDPPYGLGNTSSAQVAETVSRWVSGEREYMPGGSGFTGRAWDAFVPPVAVWDECLRVLKPGGHLAAFAGSRTYDLMTLAVRLAGFDVRDGIAWLYGSGFPKSHNLAGDHEGWGTALKPAFEPAVLARKPLAGTVAANALEHGTGALHIDACRVGDEVRVNGYAGNGSVVGLGTASSMSSDGETVVMGRWPTNVLLDPEQADELDRQAADLEGGASRFFPVFRYEAKAPTSERPRHGETVHTTVKPLGLMRWLVRLITPPGGTVLEPFAGSGTTAEACVIEGFECIAVEREAEYLPLIEARLTKEITVTLEGTW